MHTAIIGGGAAGVAAAIAAAERGQRVTVLERGAKPLKKLGITGNGRGNLLNLGAPAYYGDAGFAQAVLARIPCRELMAFFASIGVPLRLEGEGRLYPAALMASVAVEALLLRARQLGVTFIIGTRVMGIRREGEGFAIQAMQQAPLSPGDKPSAKGLLLGDRRAASVPETPLTLHADRVIVTVGGTAAPMHGTDGTAYGLLTDFGHRLTALAPAMCALATDKRRIAGLAGQRLRAGLRLRSATGGLLHATQGEVLFAEDAVSGIAAMQLARFAQPGATLSLDVREAAGWADGTPLTPSAAPAQATGARTGTDAVATHLQTLATLRADCPLAELLTGIFTTLVARWLCREAGLRDPGVPIGTLGTDAMQKLAATLCDVRLPITGTRGFAQAQVTAGGIATADFDPATLQSKLQPGLYAAGEVLDVDGDCGGFNLMFAFASGLLAGRAG